MVGEGWGIVSEHSDLQEKNGSTEEAVAGVGELGCMQWWRNSQENKQRL